MGRLWLKECGRNSELRPSESYGRSVFRGQKQTQNDASQTKWWQPALAHVNASTSRFRQSTAYDKGGAGIVPITVMVESVPPTQIGHQDRPPSALVDTIAIQGSICWGWRRGWQREPLDHCRQVPNSTGLKNAESIFQRAIDNVMREKTSQNMWTGYSMSSRRQHERGTGKVPFFKNRERNYATNERELLTIMGLLENWYTTSME